MKHRLATPYVLLSVSLLSTLAGCHVLVDEMIANSTISGSTGKNASNANERNNSRNSNRRGGRVVRPNPSGEIPIVNPISDGSGGGGTPGGGGPPSPAPPPVTTPPSPPGTTLPTSSSHPHLAWTGSGTPVLYSATSNYAANDIVYKDGKYYKAKFGTAAGTDPSIQGNNGPAWKRVNPNGTDYLQTGQANATPYDANTTYNDPAPPTGQNYYVTHNGEMWQANATAGQFSGTTPRSGGAPIRWTVVSGGTVTLKDSLGNTLGTIATTGGKRVLTIQSGPTVIRDNAFKNKNLEKVTFPTSTPGITAIGESAFEGNPDLTSVNIPSSVKHIKDNAFKNTDLRTVTIPSGVTTIGKGAFESNTNLTTVTIPNSVTSIGERAFKDTGLTSVTIPNSVASIETGAFMDAEDLTTVTIPTSVTSIGNDAFRNTGLTSVTIPTSVTDIGTGAFAGITSLTSVTFVSTSSVTSIGNDAFSNTGLNTVRIPTSVTSIGTGAFAGTSLTSVRISQALLSAAPTNAFPTPTPPATITFRDHSGNIITP